MLTVHCVGYCIHLRVGLCRCSTDRSITFFKPCDLLSGHPDSEPIQSERDPTGGSSLRRLWFFQNGPVRNGTLSINVRSADASKRMTQTGVSVSAQSATEIMNIVRIIYLHIQTQCNSKRTNEGEHYYEKPRIIQAILGSASNNRNSEGSMNGMDIARFNFSTRPRGAEGRGYDYEP